MNSTEFWRDNLTWRWDGFFKLPSEQSMHWSGSFIMANNCMDWYSISIDDSSAQIMWLFLIEGLLKAKIHSLRVENAKQTNPSIKHHLLSLWHPQSLFWSLRASPCLLPPISLPLNQNMSKCGSPTWNETQTSPFLSSLPHIISLHLFWSSSFQAFLCAASPSTHTHIKPLGYSLSNQFLVRSPGGPS